MTKDETGILWEEINERLKLIQEVLSGFKDMRADIRHIKADLLEMKQWRSIADLVVKDHSKTLNNHETRLTNLEAS